jgi:hypothetical protein
MNTKKLAKLALLAVAGALAIYVGSVVYIEARLGYLQPQGGATIVIATFDDGGRHERVVRLTKIEGENYIAAQHWPRAWYRQALNNPNIEVKMADVFEPYIAVPLAGSELAMVKENYQMGFSFRFRTGFPPRRFLRLDPR